MRHLLREVNDLCMLYGETIRGEQEQWENGETMKSTVQSIVSAFE